MVTKRTTTRTTRRPQAATPSGPVTSTDPAPDATHTGAVGGSPIAPVESTTLGAVEGPDPAAAAAAVPAGVRVEMVDPAVLLVDVNVRVDARLDADFVGSVRDLGVLVPVVAVRTSGGGLRVRFGHRRTLAAVQAALPAIPVVVAGDEAADDDRAGQVERLLGQWAENEHRAGLTTAERVGVVAQLAAFGVTPAQMAKRTRLHRRDVDAALTVAGDDLAAAATARYDFLDLVQASVVADFSDDPDAVKALVAAAKTGQFDHVAQRLRDTRTERRARNAAADLLRAAGVTVIDRPEYGSKTTRLGNLTNTPDNPDSDASATRVALTVETHADCPGHAAYLTEAWVRDTDRASQPTTSNDETSDAADGESGTSEVTEASDGDDLDDAEGDDEDDEDDDADEGDEPGGRWEWVPTYVCTDPTGNGHHPLYGKIPVGKPTTAEMTDEQREAARAERRDVIESNKAWDSAQAVRRDWLRTFLARKTAPKGTATFLAAALAYDGPAIADANANTLAADLLGLPSRAAYGRHTGLAEAAEQAADARAQVIALAQALAGYEAGLDRTAWRNPRTATTRYLDYIATHGYTLSDVENRARRTT